MRPSRHPWYFQSCTSLQMSTSMPDIPWAHFPPPKCVSAKLLFLLVAWPAPDADARIVAPGGFCKLAGFFTNLIPCLVHIAQYSLHSLPFLDPKHGQGMILDHLDSFSNVLDWPQLKCFKPRRFSSNSSVRLWRSTSDSQDSIGVSLNGGTPKTPQNDHF